MFDFVIVGAPKAGTDSLRNFLNTHPSIYIDGPMEGNYLCTDIAVRNKPFRLRIKYGVNKFWKRISTYRQKIIFGEKSTWYLASKLAARKICSHKKKPKVIVLTRDRFLMVKSLHNELVKLGHEPLPLDIAWDASFTQKNRIKFYNKIIGDYSDSCKIGEQIKFYIDLLGHERIMILTINDLDKNETKDKLFNFLGLESIHECQLNFLNKSIRLGSNLCMNQNIELKLKRKIQEYFAEDIYLEKMLIYDNHMHHSDSR